MPVKATLGVDARIARINGTLGAGAAAPTMGAAGVGDGRSAFSFDGGDYVNVYSAKLAAAFDGAQGTLLIWVRISDAAVWADGTFRRFALIGADATNQVTLYKSNVANQIRFQYYAGGVSILVSDTSLAASTAWFLVGITWDKPADQVKLFLNDAQVGGTQTGLGTWAGSIANAFLGADSTVPGNPHKGLLAHCAVGAGAVPSTADFAAIYAARTGNMRSAILTRNPIAYWMLDDDSGTTAKGETFDWSDVTADVRTIPPLKIRYGIDGDSPQDRVAGTGTFDFSLDNGPNNSTSASGAYSPNHASVRDGFAVGSEFRAKFTYSGSTVYKHLGRLDSVEPQPGKFGGMAVRCQSLDWFDEAARYLIRLLPVQTNKRADENIATVVACVPKKPGASTLAAGKDTFPYALDNSRDESTLALTEVVKNTMSELGYCYPIADQVTGGHLIFDDRHARPKTTTVSASFSDDMVRMDVDRGRRGVFNRVRIGIHPRLVDSASQVLFTMQAAPLVPATASIAIFGAYTDPANVGAVRVGGASMITPVATTDYTGNSASDGTGENRTSDVSISASYGGNSVKYAVSNTSGTDLYLTVLQARGFGIYDREPLYSEAVDQTSIDDFGEQTLQLDMPYQDDPLVGDDAANYLLGANKDPATAVRSITFVANRSGEFMGYALLTEPGDLISVVESMTGLNKQYFVNGVDLQYDQDEQLICTFRVAPADTSTYWILGVTNFSELDETTRLGY